MESPKRVRIGEMLVGSGLLKREDLERALTAQKASGARLGHVLVELGLVTEIQLTQMLSNQLSVPWVSLYHVEFSRELLNLVPAATAEEFCLIPVYVREVRGQGRTLFVAMDDPSNEQALAKVRESSGLPVKPMVAPPTDIRNAIRVYYFGGGRAEVPASGPTPQKPSPPPPAHPKSKSSPERAQAPADERRPARPSKPTSASAGASPKKAPRMVTLTLLDGTTFSLPSRSKKVEVGSEAGELGHAGLTAKDLVAALYASAEGADVSDVLPDRDRKWERLVGALLAILLRKGLIADWEFVEELEKRRA